MRLVKSFLSCWSLLCTSHWRGLVLSVLRVAFVPGVTPDKWFYRWQQRYPQTPLSGQAVTEAEQRRVLVEAEADFCFVRPPVDRTGLQMIPLYTEPAVVLAPKDHPLTAFEALTMAELEDEEWLEPSAELSGQQLNLIAAGAGLLLLPQSHARQLNRRDLRFRPVTDAPEHSIALAWLAGRDEPEIEDFIGVVRGRTANSSRGNAQADSQAQKKPEPKKPQQKKSDPKKQSQRQQPSSRSRRPKASRGKPRGGR